MVTASSILHNIISSATYIAIQPDVMSSMPWQTDALIQTYSKDEVWSEDWSRTWSSNSSSSVAWERTIVLSGRGNWHCVSASTTVIICVRAQPHAMGHAWIQLRMRSYTIHVNIKEMMKSMFTVQSQRNGILLLSIQFRWNMISRIRMLLPTTILRILFKGIRFYCN